MIKTLQQFKDLVLSGHKPAIGSAPASLVNGMSHAGQQATDG